MDLIHYDPRVRTNTKNPILTFVAGKNDRHGIVNDVMGYPHLHYIILNNRYFFTFRKLC